MDKPKRFHRTPMERTDTTQRMLHDAIERLCIVRFIYQNRERIVEPHILGVKNDRVALLSWQIGGSSSRGSLPDWRLFYLDTLSDVMIMEATFTGSRITPGGRAPPFDRHIVVVR
jgi:hypothetical protein